MSNKRAKGMVDVALFSVSLCSATFLFFAVQQFFGPQNSQAADKKITDKLGKLETTDVSVMLVDVGKAVSIALSPKAGFKKDGALAPTVFTTEDPARVVVDIPMKGTPQRTQKMKLNHSLFSGMRLGTHPNKTRLVIDMKKDFAPAYKITPIKKLGAVLINFRLPGNQEIEQPKRIEPIEDKEEKSVQKDEEVESSKRFAYQPKLNSAPLLPIARTTAPKSTKVARYSGARFQPGVVIRNGIITHRGAPAPKGEKASKPGISQVKYMRFVRSKLSGLDSLSIRVEKVYGISLKPVGEAAYQLTLKKTELGDHIKALKPGIGFHKVVPHQDGENLVVDIEVKLGVQLAADMNDGLLLLRATSNS